MLTEFTQSIVSDLATFYRKHLLEDVMPFWEVRTKDLECGGYLTCFDRFGNLTDANKYIWFQGRQLWMFSALYNQVESRSAWLDLASWGREFIVSKAYAGGGRWNYQLDRNGCIQQGTISIYTDMFVLQGLCEYATASGHISDYALINDTYRAIESNTQDLDFKDIFHGVWSPQFKRHAVYMIAINTAQIAEQVLGAERTRTLIDHCLDQILNVFVKDDRRALFESVDRNGNIVNNDEGRVLNPGHALESMWFCLEEGIRRKDQVVIDRAVQVIDWMYERGKDTECGGIFAYLDADGDVPKQMDWHKETGMEWHDKPWWVFTESMYALALAAVETGRDDMFGRFVELHEWSQKYCYDREYGEWYAEYYRDGRPKLTDKGTPWKSAYHLPRSLMKVMQLFDRYVDS